MTFILRVTNKSGTKLEEAIFDMTLLSAQRSYAKLPIVKQIGWHNGRKYMSGRKRKVLISGRAALLAVFRSGSVLKHNKGVEVIMYVKYCLKEGNEKRNRKVVVILRLLHHLLKGVDFKMLLLETPRVTAGETIT